MDSPVLVFGVGGGVGSEVAKLLIAAGETVIGTVRSEQQIAPTYAALPGLAALFHADLRDPESVLQTLRHRFAGKALKGVILCAAASDYGPLETLPLSDARDLFEINALSSLAIYQGCIEPLRVAGGRLVLVSSYSGRITLPFVGAYQASKFALEALADVMRMEGGMSGVGVVLIEPGGINTSMARNMATSVKNDIASLSADEDARYGMLYRSFLDMNEAADWSKMSSARQVADVILQALTALDPEPRYIVGDDAEYFINERKRRSDREMDALALAIYNVP